VGHQNELTALLSILKFNFDRLGYLQALRGGSGLRLVASDQPRKHLLEADPDL
jgi:hypothetical protein